MKTIGIIGGMSWESTVVYYRHINQIVAERLGGFHSAQILLCSVDFHRIEEQQSAGRWEESGEDLAAIARNLEAAGADVLLLATNTMHRVAEQIESSVEIPFLHIADATAQRIPQDLERVALLGTRFTMEEDFYRSRLARRAGVEVLTPELEAREIVDRIIYEELVRGQVLESSRVEYRRIVSQLESRGARAVVLGCTEIGLLLRPGDTSLPLFDTARIHAEAAAEFALATDSAESPGESS